MSQDTLQTLKDAKAKLESHAVVQAWLQHEARVRELLAIPEVQEYVRILNHILPGLYANSPEIQLYRQIERALGQIGEVNVHGLEIEKEPSSERTAISDPDMD